MNGIDNPAPMNTRLVPLESLNAITSLVAEGAVFEGSFSSRNDLGLRVDGVLKGNVSFASGGTLHVSATGLVEQSHIEADHVLIEGQVRGTVIARKTLEVTGSATVVGDLVYDTQLDIHPRARLRGKMEYRGEIETPAG